VPVPAEQQRVVLAVPQAELGLRPGPQPCELRRTILAEEPTGRPITVAQPAVTPAQLPAEVIGFTGRDDQLRGWTFCRMPTVVSGQRRWSSRQLPAQLGCASRSPDRNPNFYIASVRS
jgi:hypothetical protein